MRTVLASVFALVLAGVAASCAAPDDLHDGAATVVEIIDGDTLVARFGNRTDTIRLIGIDTPETVHPDRPVECFGPEATAFLNEVLPPGTHIRVHRDTVARDHFDRLLGYVYRASDEMFVNGEIISRGFGRPLSIPPNDIYAVEFVKRATKAERANHGVWAACGAGR
ncbi:MAG: thermonuclease family protein [Actinomycetota bacterium]